MLASSCTIPVSAGGKFLDANYFCNALYCAIPFHSVQSNEITETGKGILNQLDHRSTECNLVCTLEQENHLVWLHSECIADALSMFSIHSPEYVFSFQSWINIHSEYTTVVSFAHIANYSPQN